ncbi:DUF4292 domain-containing protein [Mucilaginibacter sp. Bleaf8]|uniref:DUF4292 domain-containing protein n=1 Tax=Mucilaginibacter sp. Bleaf8 TaxID=2834430 RepID=UPI001BCEC736|nr:DUF4292 domain-containing protein [Mucilaginibacter sp. Bleaf8]MBS7566056.1 DUF4292 domain-containing protein [Mucilaginibacter sp. Bleaf8]
MRRNILSKLLVVCLVVAAGCKTKKQVVARTPVNTTNNADAGKLSKIQAIQGKQVSFNTFSGKAKTKLNIDGKTNDVTLNIRIQHDQKIWVSITALLGVEVARALITPDSIMVINRLQGVYIKKPFSYIHTYAGQQVNYKTVESLLIGNVIPDLLTPAAIYQEGANGGVSVKGSLQGIVYSLLIGADLKVTQTSLANQSAAQSLQVTNSEFIQADGKVIPSQINIASAVKQKNIQADLHYNKAEFNQPLEFPFSIPDRFSPAN